MKLGLRSLIAIRVEVDFAARFAFDSPQYLRTAMPKKRHKTTISDAVPF